MLKCPALARASRGSKSYLQKQYLTSSSKVNRIQQGNSHSEGASRELRLRRFTAMKIKRHSQVIFLSEIRSERVVLNRDIHIKNHPCRSHPQFGLGQARALPEAIKWMRAFLSGAADTHGQMAMACLMPSVVSLVCVSFPNIFSPSPMRFHRTC